MPITKAKLISPAQAERQVPVTSAFHKAETISAKYKPYKQNMTVPHDSETIGGGTPRYIQNNDNSLSLDDLRWRAQRNTFVGGTAREYEDINLPKETAQKTDPRLKGLKSALKK